MMNDQNEKADDERAGDEKAGDRTSSDAPNERSSAGVSDDEVIGLCRRLARLLEDPQPGLLTWLTMRIDVARKLRDALSAKLADGERDGTRRG